MRQRDLVTTDPGYQRTTMLTLSRRGGMRTRVQTAIAAGVTALAASKGLAQQTELPAMIGRINR